MTDITPLREFVTRFTRLIDRNAQHDEVQGEGQNLLRELIATDTWLPDAYARPHPERYTQYLLHCDPIERFSVVSFVWGPGQRTPLHDHRVWGLIGILRGREGETQFVRGVEGEFTAAETVYLERGDVAVLAPDVNDYHQVSNGLDNATSVSIHVYGANIGAVKRATYDPVTSEEKLFISGYSNTEVPNLWDRSR